MINDIKSIRNLKLNKVVKVYTSRKNRVNGCLCGCNGSWKYPSVEGQQEAVGYSNKADARPKTVEKVHEIVMNGITRMATYDQGQLLETFLVYAECGALQYVDPIENKLYMVYYS